MNRRDSERNQYVDPDPESGGMSAGAQNGGIVDTGSANDDTDYIDALTGRKGGMAGTDTDDDFVGGGDFEDEEESAGIGDTFDADDI